MQSYEVMTRLVELLAAEVAFIGQTVPVLLRGQFEIYTDVSPIFIRLKGLCCTMKASKINFYNFVKIFFLLIDHLLKIPLITVQKLYKKSNTTII